MASTPAKYVPTPWNVNIQIHLLMALFYETIGNGSYYKNTCEIVDEAKFIHSATTDLLCTFGWTKEAVAAVAQTMCCSLTVGEEAGRRKAALIVLNKAVHETHKCDQSEGECFDTVGHKEPSVLDLCHLITERRAKIVVVNNGDKVEELVEGKNDKASGSETQDEMKISDCATDQELDSKGDDLKHME